MPEIKFDLLSSGLNFVTEQPSKNGQSQEEDDEDEEIGNVPIRPHQKRTRGKQKIPIQFISDRIRRCSTFSKRKTGLMKKAFELAKLTGAQVLLVVASETSHVYTYTTDRLKAMVESESGRELIQECLGQQSPLSSLRTRTSLIESPPLHLPNDDHSESVLSSSTVSSSSSANLIHASPTFSSPPPRPPSSTVVQPSETICSYTTQEPALPIISNDPINSSATRLFSFPFSLIPTTLHGPSDEIATDGVAGSGMILPFNFLSTPSSSTPLCLSMRDFKRLRPPD